jgi:tRNA pseudouridine13 synthase
MDALSAIARELGISRKQIGFAGHKDSRAISRQWISIENIEPGKIKSLAVRGVKILQLGKHSEGLRSGMLAGNKFYVRLRKVNLPSEQAVKAAEKIMAELISRGSPNYFGPQRFGLRNDSHILGCAIAKGDCELFADTFLGGAEMNESPAIAKAREFYKKGDYQKSYDLWPYVYADQRRALKTLVERKGSKKQAYHVVDKNLKGFFVSAYQSYLFNLAAATRMPDIDKILAGDIAYDHTSKEFFRVENSDTENLRCQNFQISPTGPLFGSQMMKLNPPAAEIENRVIEAAGLSERDFRQMSEYGAKGARRPLRFQPHNAIVSAGRDRNGSYIELRFELDPGCYATCLIREITKADIRV